MINIKEIDKKFDMTLCKVNKEVVAVILDDYLNSIHKSIDGIDELELSIPKYIVDNYTFNIISNNLYQEVKNERLICLNDREYFVIKEDDFSSNNKTIKAYSLEYKLGKIDINVEEIGFYLIKEDKENDIYSLDNYMYTETGWKFGHIDDSVRYDIAEDGTKTDKMRWQQSVSTRWYDFLMKEVSESFGCVVVFDTYNKLVNLYDINTQGEEVQVYLSYDNYIKDLQRKNSSSDIVTRLYLTGNEEMDIIGHTPTGYPYLENYSYFIENGEMSLNLTNAMIKYYEMIEIRRITWNELVTLKQNKMTILTDKKNELYLLYAQISALKNEIKVYISKNDDISQAIAQADLTIKNDARIILEVAIKNLSDEIISLQSSIDEINVLCKRETATEENGVLIFNQMLLDELKEFVYCDTYSNDSFKNVEDLINAGERELSLKCKPTTTYELSVVDFTKRILDTGFRKHWNGELSLGNIISLRDDDLNEEILQYFVGYNLNLKDENGLSLEISDRKIREDNTRTIADYLSDARRSMETLNAKKYLWNKQKYNKINL